jgi:glycine C-acetyltransferase
MFTNVEPYLAQKLSEIEKAGLFKRERLLDGPQQAEVRLANAPSVLNLCANNYLGLANHPAVVEAARQALDTWGYGLASVRFICGTQSIHKQLEEKLSEFLGTEDTILYGSCFDANGGLFETLLDQEDAVISDELNHASIIDGARLSRATIKVFPHKDVDAARKVLQELPAGQRKLLITDGVFSMDGDLGALPALCALAEEYGCIMMVDDAHASGVFGTNGRGTIDHFGMHGRVDIQVGTLSKAIGALGGYVAGSRALIEFLYHRARPFLFSTSHPPAVAAACIAAIDVLEQEPEIIERLWENTRFFKAGLNALGFNTGTSDSPITPVIAGDGALAMKLSDRLFEEGVFAQGIAFPTVARDKARVRTIVTATHTRDELQFALDAFARVGRELGLI